MHKVIVHHIRSTKSSTKRVPLRFLSKYLRAVQNDFWLIAKAEHFIAKTNRKSL